MLPTQKPHCDQQTKETVAEETLTQPRSTRNHNFRTATESHSIGSTTDGVYMTRRLLCALCLLPHVTHIGFIFVGEYIVHGVIRCACVYHRLARSTIYFKTRLSVTKRQIFKSGFRIHIIILIPTAYL